MVIIWATDQLPMDCVVYEAVSDMSEEEKGKLLLVLDDNMGLKELRQLPLARTLKADWKQIAETPHATQSDQSEEELNVSVCSDDSECSRSLSWAHNFVPPWEKCNPDLIEACKNGKSPLESHRREMVRIFADAILRVERNPRLRDVEIVALGIVKKYPVFKDKVVGSPEESSVAGGYITMSRWILNRIGNVKRGFEPDIKTRLKKKSRIVTFSSWAHDFVPPWDKCNPDLIEACENGIKPWEPHRREMIRVFADAILRAEPKPKMRDIELIAKNIVKKYPVFKDKTERNRPTSNRKYNVDGDYVTMYRWIYNRIGNITRIQRNYKMENDTTHSSTKRHKKSDEYGCENFAPDVTEDHKNIMEENRSWLVEEFRKEEPNNTQVSLLMEQTYPLQRNYINQNISIENLCKAWPFLFQSDHLFSHYEKLVGKKDVKKVLLESLQEGGLYLYRAMRQHCHDREVLLCVGIIDGECRLRRSDEAKFSGHFDLLSAYFNEPVTALYKCVESDTVDVDDSILVGLPSWPFLVVHGNTISAAAEYSIYIQNQKVASFDSVGESLCYMFCCYYVFNIKYPEENVATLEFIQRYFAKINVLKSKTEKFTRSPVNPKVLKLARFLSSCDSSE